MAGRVVREGCVLLLGKSGAGKSTMANHLVGHDPLSPDKPPFRVNHKVLASRTTEVEHNTVEFMWENDLYRLTVVDTPGLNPTMYTESDLIFDKIVQYIRETKLRIDLVFFVFKKNRFTAEEKYLFSFFMEKFRSAPAIVGCPKDISYIFALVVTACEGDDTTEREELVQGFKVNPSTREVASQMGMGIYPVGFPPMKRMYPPLQQAYMPGMVQDRDTLRGLIARARPSSTDVKLTMANLTSLKTADGDSVQIIEAIAPKWKTVGYLMDFDPDGRKVDVIEANYAHKQNGVVTCCQEIFKLWLRGKDATWKKLNEILNSSGHKVLAEQVMDAVGLL